MENLDKKQDAVPESKPVEPVTSQTSTLGHDLHVRHARRFGPAVIIVIILVSLLAGAVGGVAGVVYAPKIPALQKFLNEKQALQSVTQQVVLDEDSSVIDVVQKAGPAVVSIIISKDLNKLPGYGYSPFGFDPFFQQFFGDDNQQQAQDEPNVQQIGAGSGFFVSSDGLIITNKHVVSDEQATYSVITPDGKTYDAQVLSRDPINDLAIVKIDIKDAPILNFADSSKIQVGQRVIAIGNSLGQYQNTVTTGVVSGIGRSIVAGGGSEGTESLEGVIQTDAAINPGNSGGPLLNDLGQVIGINTAVDREGQLVGFALPANDAQRALDSYKKYGKITRPFLGVRYILITADYAKAQKLPRDYGALVVRGQAIGDVAVVPGSPADKAGLGENDIILSVDGIKVDENHTLVRLLSSHNVGDTITIKIYHRGEEKDVSVKLEENK